MSLGSHWIPVLCVFLQVVVVSRSHVVLTFPPARKYALDFLDNAGLPRTMCGMPKGLVPMTSLLAGTTINVTWNMAYPHKGGFKLEVLDNLERPVMDLTPMIKGSRFLSYNKLAQNHEIALPKDFECKNCSIRLLREVVEIDPEFFIRSCADVDIVKNGYTEDCMRNGIFQNGKCNCRIPFVGNRCQYENECAEDSDCGQHGRCLFIDHTNYPMKQCFCETGWFGDRCNKESKLNSKVLKLESYHKKELSPNMKMYWQLLDNEEEIEIVVMAKTVSYVAIGWRPTDIGSECKAYSNLEPPASAKTEIRKGKELALGDTILSNFTTKSMEGAQSSTTTSVPNTDGVTSTSIVSDSNSPDTTTMASTKTIPVTSSTKIRFPTRRPNLSRRLPGKLLTSRTTPQTTTTPPPPPTTITTTTPPPPPTTTEIPSTSTLSSNEELTERTTIMIIEVKSESSIQEDQEEPQTTDEQTSSEDQSGMSSEVPSVEQESVHSKKSSMDDMDTAASEETVSNVQVKSYGEEGSKLFKREVTTQQMGESPNDSSTQPLHPMDCIDMVVGSARGDYSRVGDYYSIGMSTPRKDDFWGGTQDLTAAMGFQANGVTVIMFRKKLKTEEKTDYSISDSTMHFIWAMGQVESNNVPDQFYTADALQYHGDGNQRGVTTVNFRAGTVHNIASTKPVCRGEWKFPSKCVVDDCEYKASWEYENETDYISFTLFTNHTNTWTGIGFSNDTKMNNTDVIIGWVNDNGKHFMMDMWISGYAAPILDPKQDIEFERGQRNTSGTTLMFKRKRNTRDVNDLAFTNSECLYLIFPYHGGTYNSVNKKIQMHTKTPLVSSKRICMPECEDLHDIKSETSDEFLNAPSDYSTSTGSVSSLPPTEPTLSLIIRLPLEDAIFTESEEIQKAAKSKIQSEVHSVLKDVSGYKSVTVSNVSRDPNVTNWLLAAMNIQVDNYLDSENESAIEHVIRSSVAEGKIGSLRVDPNFIYLQVPQDWSSKTDSTDSTSIDVVRIADTHLIAIYAIIAAVSILGLLICIQVICTICRYTKTKNTTISKEQLLANSGWKDYSTTASSNYSYEPFSSNNYDESTGKVSKNPIGSNSSKYRTDQRNNNGHHQHHHHHHQQQQQQQQQPQQQHRNTAGNAPSSAMQLPAHDNGKGHYSRRSESLPRANQPSSQPAARASNYATHDRAVRNNPPKGAMELQPDFYFMPSQRRYKGEVVRVYVDYNNPNYNDM